MQTPWLFCIAHQNDLSLRVPNTVIMPDVVVKKDELEFLRDKVRSKFQKLAKKEFAVNSNKGSYGELETTVKEYVEKLLANGNKNNVDDDAGKSTASTPVNPPHISSHLLRKLYYDTKDFDKTVFRNSFLDSCMLFITDGEKDWAEYVFERGQKTNVSEKEIPEIILIKEDLKEESPELESNKALLRINRRKRILLFVGLIGISVALILYFSSTSHIPTNYKKRFTNSNIDELAKDGWFLQNKDTDYWGRYKDSGYLTLETFEGDSWLNHTKYKPYVKNVLTKKIYLSSCGSISIKLKNFNPYQRYQQAGFFLYYNNLKTDYPNLRMTYAFSKIKGRDSGWNIIQVVRKHHEFGSEPLTHKKLNKVEAGVHLDTINSLWMRIEIEENLYKFSYRTDDEGEYLPIREEFITLPQPTYIGLTAFQGFPLVPPPIPVADTIPAHIERIEIKSCRSGLW